MTGEPSLVTLAVQLARVEAKQDAILSTMSEHVAADAVVHTDHEKRVRSLERSRWHLTGLTAGVALVFSTVGAFAAKLFQGG